MPILQMDKLRFRDVKGLVQLSPLLRLDHSTLPLPFSTVSFGLMTKLKLSRWAHDGGCTT